MALYFTQPFWKQQHFCWQSVDMSFALSLLSNKLSRYKATVQHLSHSELFVIIV